MTAKLLTVYVVNELMVCWVQLHIPQVAVVKVVRKELYTPPALGKVLLHSCLDCLVVKTVMDNVPLLLYTDVCRPG